jgi:hypothetical protein
MFVKNGSRGALQKQDRKFRLVELSRRTIIRYLRSRVLGQAVELKMLCAETTLDTNSRIFHDDYNLLNLPLDAPSLY